MPTNPSIASPNLPPPSVASVQADFLAMFDRLLPPEYLSPMKLGQGPGYELLQAFAALGARVSTAVARAWQQAYIGSATGGAYAVAHVQLYRADPIPDGITTVAVQSGTVLRCSGSGRMFVTVADVVFAPSALGPIGVFARAVEQNYEYNVLGERIAANGQVIPGEIDTIYFLREAPAFGDPSIQVRQLVDAHGGVPPALDQIGADRNMPRVTGEDDVAYRARLKQLPDTVSPAAMRRAIARAFAPWRHGFAFIEAWDPQLQLCYDVPSNAPGFDPTVGFLDDTRAYPPLRNRVVDEGFFRGAFVVVVDNLGAIAEHGWAYDDTALNADQLVSPDTGGKRAPNALDLPTLMPAGELPGTPDGMDLIKQSVYLALDNLLRQIKPAGVDFAFVMPNPTAVLFPVG